MPAVKDDKTDNSPRDLVRNRKARHLYEIIDKIETGIELKGAEVKSLRDGGGSIAEAWVTPRGGEMFLTGMTIPPYTNGSGWDAAPTRDRKLLMHKKEIERWTVAVSQKGMTIVPLRVYLTPRGRVKIEIGLGRGKDSRDKRADIRERDMKREMDREYKIR